MADKKTKAKKPSFRERMAEHGRDAKHLGRTLKDEPQSLPREVGGIVRRSLRRIWDARGGGLYACGFLATFVYLEVTMFFGDIAEADSVSGFITGQVTEMLFKYLGESIMNTVTAFIWPVYVIQVKPPWGLIVLAGAFVVFDRFFKTRIETWLFGTDGLPPRHNGDEAG
jgi:hypothetical protein